MHTHAIVLCNLHPNSDVFIAGEKDCIADCFLARELDHIGYNQGVDSLLLSVTVNKTKTKLGIVKISDSRLIG